MLKITFRDRFSYTFHTDILYAFRVRIPSMIDNGSTDTNQRFQILTRRPFPVRDLVEVFAPGLAWSDFFWLYYMYIPVRFDLNF